MESRHIDIEIDKQFVNFKRGMDKMAQVLYTKDGQPVDDLNPLPTQPSKVNVKDFWSGSAGITKTFSGPRTSLMIANDGSGDVTVTVGSITFPVKSTEVFDEKFDPFTQVVIATTSAYRAWARG
jgi:hypothetical protein